MKNGLGHHQLAFAFAVALGIQINLLTEIEEMLGAQPQYK